MIGYLCNKPGSGLDNYIFGILNSLVEENIDIDVLVSNYNNNIEDRFRCYRNINLIKLPRLRFAISQYKVIRKLVKKNSYDCAYFNISEAFNCVGNLASKKYTTVITHSHSSGIVCSNKISQYVKTKLNNAFRTIIRNNSDYLYACSRNAANWVYGNDSHYRLIRNTIEKNKFLYNPKTRKLIRDKLNISSNSKVMGFVGSLSEIKQPKYLLDLFDNLKRHDSSWVLLIIGDGHLREKLEKRVVESQLRDVLFLGNIDNVNDYYSSMDVFVLPSRFEGYPIVGVEAQVNDLPCFFSNSITDEILLNPKSRIFSTNFDNINKVSKEIEKSLLWSRSNRPQLSAICDHRQQSNEIREIFINGEY